MPSIQDIEKFNASLVSIGDEPAVLKERGENLEEVEAPGEGLPPDLSELLDDGGGESGEHEQTTEDLGEEDFLQSFATAMQETEAETAGDPFSDIDLDLSFDESAPAAAEAPGEEAPGAEQAGEADDLGVALDEAAPDEAAPDEAVDWADAFGLTEEAEGPAEEPSSGEPAAGQEEREQPESFEDEDFADFGEASADIEDFSLDDFDLPDFDAEGAAEETPEAAGAAEEEQGSDDAFAFDEGADFEDAFADEQAPADEAVEDEVPEDEAPEEFDIDDFDVDGEPAPSAGDALADLEEQDEFSFDLEEGVPDTGDEFSFEDESFETAEDEALEGAEELGEPSEEFEDIDQFSLDDFGAEFGVTEEEELGVDEDFEIEEEAGEEAEPAESEFEISEDDFAAVQRTLGTLPLNLKVEVEELIAESKGTTEQLRRLVDLLAKGESARTVADYAGKILGKEIRIPRGYEKRTGVEFEEERRTFAYRFRENILPVLRVVATAGTALALLVFLAYQLVYRPIRAHTLYVAGYNDIGQEQYTEANRSFQRAHDTWVMERWFFRYADAFVDKRQYALAAEKYDQLIFGMSERQREFFLDRLNRREFDTILDIRDVHREGVLAYARMESEVIANYAKADRLLSLLLADEMYDYDALLALGDNSMEWAREEPERYEDARVAYASLIQEYGETDTLLFRMLRYFIRTDNETEVLRLKELFQDDQSVDVDPAIYAELGGYLVDKSELDDVRDILFRAMDQRDDLPEIHYHLARYFRRIDEPVEEEKALSNTLQMLRFHEPLNRRRLAMLSDTHGRTAELNYAREEYLTAERHYRSGIDVYEDALERDLIEPDPTYGRLYAGLGDINYYVALDYDAAAALYQEAEANLYTNREMDYRQGYINYRNSRYGAALEDFHDASGGFSRNLNLLYATANSLYHQRSYFAAEAYYLELLDRLGRQRAQINNLLVDEDPAHRQLVEYLVRVNNNLGITLNRLSENTGDADKFSRGLVYLKDSSEYSENLARDRRTMERSSTVNLAFLNTREILYPEPNYELQLYHDIPRDFQDVSF